MGNTVSTLQYKIATAEMISQSSENEWTIGNPVVVLSEQTMYMKICILAKDSERAFLLVRLSFCFVPLSCMISLYLYIS